MIKNINMASELGSFFKIPSDSHNTKAGSLPEMGNGSLARARKSGPHCELFPPRLLPIYNKEKIYSLVATNSTFDYLDSFHSRLSRYDSLYAYGTDPFEVYIPKRDSRDTLETPRIFTVFLEPAGVRVERESPKDNPGSSEGKRGSSIPVYKTQR